MLKNEEIISDEVEVAFLFEHSKKFQKILLITIPHSLSRHPTLNAILKYKDHPSIRAIKIVSQRFSSFYFSPVDKNTVLKEIRKLKPSKAVQDTDITVKN